MTKARAAQARRLWQAGPCCINCRAFGGRPLPEHRDKPNARRRKG